MYTLKSIARRGTALGMATAMLVAAVMPAASVFAQVALNPLTERSLLLSSSAPGWQDTDGSGFSEAFPNPASGVNGTPDHYAPAGSGPNGMKTGETFTFKTSSSGTIKGFSLQYCTTAAGFCIAPGNNTGDADVNDDGSTADSTRLDNEDSAPGAADGGWAAKKSDLNVVGTFTEATGAVPAAGQFVVLNGGVQSTGWTMTTANVETEDALVEDKDLTGKNNMIYLVNTGTPGSVASGSELTVKFQPSESTFITNPGDGAFFVKINTYSTSTEASMLPTTSANVIDGGVTVANVMTDSIHIVTKVLETMSFSVGIENPDTIDRTGAVQHGTCEPMSQNSSNGNLINNRLNLGNPSAEYSLETGKAWDVHSYWRLSSNSSGGATVYYSGNTLANTSGDMIADMQTEQLSNPGTEQFGLGFVDAGLDTLAGGDDTFQSGHVTPRSYPFITLSTQAAGAPYNALAAQLASSGYDDATGRINVGPGGAGTEPIEAKFQFHASSNTIPEVIAQQKESVISCATAKMRYVGNIGADTPAGVYTTKINYLAAPQY